MILLVALVLVAIVASRAFGKERTVKNFDQIYQDEGIEHNIDWRLLKAIAIQESNEDPNAVNPSDPSYGLMGILAVTDANGMIRTRLPAIADWPPSGGVLELLQPERNVHYAAEILSWNMTHFGFPRGLAVYNSWDAHTSPVNGPFTNQGYVDNVLALWQNIKAGRR